MGNLEDLARNRDALLLAEIAAWLHMFGKFHEDFLNGNREMDLKIPEIVKTSYPDLYDLLTRNWTGQLWGKLPDPGELRASGLSVYYLINKHRPPNAKQEGFARLLQDAHGRGSGVEKGLLKRDKDGANKEPAYLSTSFGSETIIDNIFIKKEMLDMYTFLQDQLGDLRTQLSNLAKGTELDEKYWQVFRRNFVSKIKTYFSQSIAESRRPVNDVTLFDQTAMSVACFKAVLAQHILEGWSDPNATAIEEKYHWYLYQVGIDEQKFWGNSARLSDLLARRRLIHNVLNNVEMLLTVTYPLAFEIYRGGNGSVYMIPGLKSGTLQNTLGNLQNDIRKIVVESSSGEAHFEFHHSERTRTLLSLGKITAQVLNPPIPDVTRIKQYWQNVTEDICYVCNLRPQGPGQKARSRKVCDICEGRRQSSTEQWANNLSETIWIDEVADAKGKLCLLVAQFDLTHWLSGRAFNTILSFDFKDQQTLHDLNRDIEEGLTQNLDILPTGILGNLIDKQARGSLGSMRNVFKTYVDSDISDNENRQNSELLLLSLIRQWPAPSRIYRTWRTTQDFWENVVANFDNTVGEVSSRLRIQGRFTSRDNSREYLRITHAYELKLGTANLSVACVGDNKFLTVDNLQRIAVLLNLQKEISGDYSASASHIQHLLLEKRDFTIEEPTGYGSSNKVLGNLHIDDVVVENTAYVPVVPILTEPSHFMAIVPADKALLVANAIKEKYEKEMGKVRNRLPLSVGVVYAGSRTPLPAILDAGRRMLKQPSEAEIWAVVTSTGRRYTEKVRLELQRNKTTITIEVPTIMGDGIIEDVWYPYWCLEKGAADAGKRERLFTGVDGKTWVHVKDLYPGDEVAFMPSHFDFEFLDTSARRFEVSYEDGKRRGSQHPGRPYYLEQLNDITSLWKTLSSGLSTAQIHNLVGLIEAKRAEWRVNQNDESAFKFLVHDVIASAGWKVFPEKQTMEQLVLAALSGQLTDVVELYMQIKSKEGKD